jgi:hypothetical protein
MTFPRHFVVPSQPIVRTLPALVLIVVAAGCGSSKPPATTTNGAAAKTPANAAYAYARCMRAHGLPGFPDPQVTTTANSGSIRIAVPSSVGNSPNFNPAQKACRAILPGPDNSSPGEQQAHRQVMLAFAHCLRAHGLTGFPDPTHNGQLSLAMISAAGIDVRSSQFLRAGTACVGVTRGAITLAQVRAVASGQH